MPELAEQMYCSQQICIPPAYPYVLRQYAKAAIRCQPSDLLKWSTAYFRCLSLNLTPPVKPRLEYPVPKSYFGITPGWLKALMFQMMTNNTISFRTLWDRWQGACLETENLIQLLVLAGFTDPLAIPWRRFIAMCAAHLTTSLTNTMILICEILTEEPEGGSAIIPLEVFLDLYQFLAAIDASHAQRLLNIYFTDEALGLTAPKEEELEAMGEEESVASVKAVDEVAIEEVAEEQSTEDDLEVVISCPDLLPDETDLVKEEDIKYGVLALNRSAGFMPTVGIIDSGNIEPNERVYLPKSDPLHTDEPMLGLVSSADQFDEYSGGEEDEDDGDVTTEQKMNTEQVPPAEGAPVQNAAPAVSETEPGTAQTETTSSTPPPPKDGGGTPSIAGTDQDPGAVGMLSQGAANIVVSQAFIVGGQEAAAPPTSMVDDQGLLSTPKTPSDRSLVQDTTTEEAPSTQERDSLLSSTVTSNKSATDVKSNATQSGNVEVPLMTGPHAGMDGSGHIITTERIEDEYDYMMAEEDEISVVERLGMSGVVDGEIYGEISGEARTLSSYGEEEASTESAQSVQIIMPVQAPPEPVGNYIDVPAVPGIGPIVPQHMVDAVCAYMKEMASRQHGMVMPRNITHYNCPPLEELHE